MKSSRPLAVVKVGGDILLDESQRLGLGENVRDLVSNGWDVVIVHGGGPQATRLQEIYGLVANKVAGRRVTSEADLTVVIQAIAGEVNVKLTSTLLGAKVSAFGCHGASGGLIRARRRPPMRVTGEGDKLVDYGLVGDVEEVNTKLLHSLLGAEVVPVVATLGVGLDGQVFNINADTTAAAIAREMSADLLILTTQVGGVFEDIKDPNSRIDTITPKSATELIDSGVIQGGMIPKVEEAISLLEQNVSSIAIASSEHLGCFVSLAEKRGQYGTLILDD